MLKIEVLDNQRRTVADALNGALRGAREFYAVVAFAKKTGFEVIEDAVGDILNQQGVVRVVYGTDFHLTDPGIIRRGLELAGTFPSGFHQFVYEHEAGRRRVTFHPKVYLATNDTMATAIVGSANLTPGGLSTNVEACISMTAAPTHPAIKSVRAFIDRHFTDHRTFVPPQDFEERYAAAYERARRYRRAADSDPVLKRLVREARKALLPGAVPTQTEFVAMALNDLMDQGAEWAHGNNQIRPRAEEKGRSVGVPYKWDTFENNVRRILGENTVGKTEGKGLFERRGGLESRSGYYRLTDAGRKLALKGKRRSKS